VCVSEYVYESERVILCVVYVSLHTNYQIYDYHIHITYYYGIYKLLNSNVNVTLKHATTASNP